MSTSNSKCGLDEGQRKRFLKDHGFVFVRAGKGSHEEWEHAELKVLSRNHKIVPPANVVSVEHQSTPWETTLCDNPANGTWKAMVRHAEWCQQTVEEIKAGSERERRRCAVVRQFREAVADTRGWRHEVKNWLKAGLPLAEAPKPPISTKELEKLRAEKNQLSSPTT